MFLDYRWMLEYRWMLVYRWMSLNYRWMLASTVEIYRWMIKMLQVYRCMNMLHNIHC